MARKALNVPQFGGTRIFRAWIGKEYKYASCWSDFPLESLVERWNGDFWEVV